MFSRCENSQTGFRFPDRTWLSINNNLNVPVCLSPKEKKRIRILLSQMRYIFHNHDNRNHMVTQVVYMEFQI